MNRWCSNPDRHSSKMNIEFNSDGRDDRAITKLGSTSEYPCWSPGGKHIAFQTYRDGNFEIYIVDSDGSNLRRVTNDEAFDGRPSWGVVKEK